MLLITLTYKNVQVVGADELFFLEIPICANITREKLEAFLVQAMESGLLTDGAIAQDINQASSFWRIREVIT